MLSNRSKKHYCLLLLEHKKGEQLVLLELLPFNIIIKSSS